MRVHKAIRYVSAAIAAALFVDAAAIAQSGAQERALGPADPNRVRAAMERHTTVLTGADAVSKRTTAEKLVGKLELISTQLGKQLSAGDLSAIESLAALETQHLNSVRQLQRSGNQDVCARRKGKSAVALIDEFDQVVNRVNQANHKFYDQLLVNLSADAKSKILAYVNRPVANGTLVRTDHRAVAKDDPDAVLAYLESYCTAPLAPRRPATTIVDPSAPIGTVIR